MDLKRGLCHVIEVLDVKHVFLRGRNPKWMKEKGTHSTSIDPAEPQTTLNL